MITCPTCNGEKVIRAEFHDVEWPCTQCKGTGEVLKEMIAWINRGKEIRAERLARKVTLRDEAKRLDVGVMTISAIERGLVDNSRGVE